MKSPSILRMDLEHVGRLYPFKPNEVNYDKCVQNVLERFTDPDQEDM